MTPEQLEQLAHVVADSAAFRLAGTAEGVRAAPRAPEIWGARSLPVVVATLACSGGASGESLVVLAPDAARTLARSLAADAFEDADELAEPQLAAIARAVDELYAGVHDALAAALELDLTFAPATAALVLDAASVPALPLDAWSISYTLRADGPELEVTQTLPASLGPASAPARPEPAAVPDPSPVAIERAAAIAAEATAEVLSTLFSEELSSATPTVEAGTSDPLAALGYPLIVAEVSYLSGLDGSNRFVLQPGDAAQLAAAMMGTPETVGDGLSAIELSAVSEAMNQVMSATAGELSKALGVTVEISPPSCIVVDSAEQARETMGECAYRASFRLVSTVFSAEIVQLVSPEQAASLEGAFASVALAQDSGDADEGFGAFDDFPAAAFAAAVPQGPEVRGGARELLSGIRVRVSAELGRARLPIARVANMPAGSIVVLDRAPADPVDVLVNGTPFAQAKVVLVDGEYAVQILSLSPLEL